MTVFVIPEYPKFEALRWDHRQEIRSMTAAFPPYSDLNFTSLWSWNVNAATEVSRLGSFLIVSMSDYVTSEPFITAVGPQPAAKVLRAVMTCLDSSPARELWLVPEAVVAGLSSTEFEAIEDRGNFDYVFSLEDAIHPVGIARVNYRNGLSKFKRWESGATSTVRLDLSDPGCRVEVRRCFVGWAGRTHDAAGTDRELLALERLLATPDCGALVAIGIRVKNELVAFAIDEVVDGCFAVGHFSRADRSIPGIYQALHREEAQCLSILGVRWLNFEQDLGLEGLRTAKMNLGPAYFLRKFTVKLRA